MNWLEKEFLKKPKLQGELHKFGILDRVPSGPTAIALETKTGLVIEVGTGTIFMDAQDLYDFIRLLKTTDKYYLKK